MDQKPSWSEAPDWADCIGYAFSRNDDDYLELLSEIYDKENVELMKGKWCYFSYPNPIGIANLEYRPEDDNIKKYYVWVYGCFATIKPSYDGIGIGIPVESTLSKIKLQKYYTFLPFISKVIIYTESQFEEQKIDWARCTPVKVENAKYEKLFEDLRKQSTKLTKEYSVILNKLANPNFEERAPKEVVLKCHADYERIKNELTLIENKLKLL